MQKPLIGILCSTREWTHGRQMQPIVSLNEAYRRGISDAGGLPMLIPMTEDPQDAARMLAPCAGLLIPGGADVDPRFYHEEPHPKLGDVVLKEDLAAIAALNYADERGLPVLGICRGLQLVNVARGGSLYQDLSEFPAACIQHLQKSARNQAVHSVVMEEGSLLGRLLGSRPHVNTMHHQCVKEPGRGLRIVGRAPDGVPEALEDEDGRVILVQWHPEELRTDDASMNSLFERLVGQASLMRAQAQEC